MQYNRISKDKRTEKTRAHVNESEIFMFNHLTAGQEVTWSVLFSTNRIDGLKISQFYSMILEVKEAICEEAVGTNRFGLQIAKKAVGANRSDAKESRKTRIWIASAG